MDGRHGHERDPRRRAARVQHRLNLLRDYGLEPARAYVNSDDGDSTAPDWLEPARRLGAMSRTYGHLSRPTLRERFDAAVRWTARNWSTAALIAGVSLATAWALRRPKPLVWVVVQPKEERLYTGREYQAMMDLVDKDPRRAARQSFEETMAEVDRVLARTDPHRRRRVRMEGGPPEHIARGPRW